MNIPLPDTSTYRASFLKKGVHYPLPTVASEKNGLLKVLPPPQTEDKIGWPWTEETDPAVYPETIQWPKITIVTPSYNQDQFLEQTIRSVLLQNYPNLEYIIIDGGSTDGSKQIIEKYSPWISYWQSEKDNGQSHAINLGFSIASGNYMAWLNSDDYYLKDVLHLVTRQFITTKVDFVYGYCYNYYVKTAKLELYKITPVVDYLIRLHSISQPSCFWSNKIHQPIWEDLHCSMDHELWLRMLPGSKRKLIKQPLSVANVHDDAKTSNPKMGEKWGQDHLLICGPNAHGVVHNWKRIMLVNRIRLKLYKWLNL